MFACSLCSEQKLSILPLFYCLELWIISTVCSPWGWNTSYHVAQAHTGEWLHNYGITLTVAAESEKQHHKSQSSPNGIYFNLKPDFSLSQYPGATTCKSDITWKDKGTHGQLLALEKSPKPKQTTHKLLSVLGVSHQSLSDEFEACLLAVLDKLPVSSTRSFPPGSFSGIATRPAGHWSSSPILQPYSVKFVEIWWPQSKPGSTEAGI